MEQISVFQPLLDVGTLKHLTDAFHLGWLGMGAITKEFEDRISQYLGLEDRYVVATNTGTSALHIALTVLGIGPGKEVITPSFNYVADHQAIVMAGAEVVMCDIRDDDLGIDCAKAELLIGPETAAIMPLHFAGIPCDQAGVYELAHRYRLRVIEDCCHAFGTTLDGKKIGSYGDIACFSFDPVKIVTCVDGGCVVVADVKEYEALQRLRLLGVDKDTTERYKNRRMWDYEVLGPGYRYHLNNIMASIGVSQIKRADEFIESRRKVCQAYSAAFAGIEGLRIPRSDFTDVSPFIYSLRVLDGKRESLINHLRSRGVDVGIHFVPVHKHVFFSRCRRGDMTVTEKVVNEVLTLPLHSLMKEESVHRVIDGVRSFFR